MGRLGQEGEGGAGRGISGGNAGMRRLSSGRIRRARQWGRRGQKASKSGGEACAIVENGCLAWQSEGAS